MKQYAVKTASGAEITAIADHFSVSSAGVAMFYRRKPGQTTSTDRNDEQVAAVPLGHGYVHLDERIVVLECEVSDLSEELEDELKAALGLTELGETTKLRLAVTVIR